MKKPQHRHYPEPLRSRSGCKVAWNYYATFKEAQECSDAAFHNAEIRWHQGYDFGYCSPGSIKLIQDGTYEVCIP